MALLCRRSLSRNLLFLIMPASGPDCVKAAITAYLPKSQTFGKRDFIYKQKMMNISVLPAKVPSIYLAE